MQLGILIHDYLSTYYGLVQEGMVAVDAHVNAQDSLSEKHGPLMLEMIEAARAAGADDAVSILADILPKATRITDRYFYARGARDANEFEILYNEIAISEELERGIVSKGRIDLVTRHRGNGRINLWEHKSTTTIPDSTTRLFDLQTPVYASQLDVEIDAVIWNYLRTKEPTEPKLTQRGMLSRAAIDTTWEVYQEAIKKYKLNPNHYEHMREPLAGRELSAYFARYEQVIVADLIIDDYIIGAYEIERQERRWAAGVLQPLRSLSRDCAWCEMLMLCKTALTGGDEEDMIRLRYTSTHEDPAPVIEEEA